MPGLTRLRYQSRNSTKYGRLKRNKSSKHNKQAAAAAEATATTTRAAGLVLKAYKYKHTLHIVLIS